MNLTGMAAAVIHFEMMRHRMERAEEGERELLTYIQLWAGGSKVAETYLKRLGKSMEEVGAWVI
jgi:hypothetical protein